MKYILRILALPGFFIMQTVFLIYTLFVRCFLWVAYGGEVFSYTPMDRATIHKIYLEIKKDLYNITI